MLCKGISGADGDQGTGSCDHHLRSQSRGAQSSRQLCRADLSLTKTQYVPLGERGIDVCDLMLNTSGLTMLEIQI